ncbi:MAG: hypothetical protein Q9184_003706 [Pyrenodesmia sp. 2 TL-2023]
MAATEFDRIDNIVTKIGFQVRNLNQLATEPDSLLKRTAAGLHVAELNTELETIIAELRPLKPILESRYQSSPSDFEKEKRAHDEWYKERKEMFTKAQAKLNDDNAALEARLTDFERAKEAHAILANELADQRRELDRQDGALRARVERANNDFSKRKKKLDDRESALGNGEAISRKKPAFEGAKLEAPEIAPTNQAKLDYLVELVRQLKVDTTNREDEGQTKLDNISETIDQTFMTVKDAKTTAGKIEKDLGAASSDLTKVKASTERIRQVDGKIEAIWDLVIKINEFASSLSEEDGDSDANQAFADRLGKAFTGIDELKRAVNDLRSRVGSSAIKRPSMANLTTSESHKRRMSALGQPVSAESSPTSERPEQSEASASGQPGTSSPLLPRTDPSRQNVDVEEPVDVPQDDASQLPNAPVAIQKVWNQIDFAEGWSAADKGKLLQFFISRELKNPDGTDYSPRNSMDHCASSPEDRTCLSSHMLKKSHPRRNQETPCKACAKSDKLCVRVLYAEEAPGAYDPESVDKRWSLHLRRWNAYGA